MQPATSFGTAPLLEHLRIFRSCNPEETDAFLRAKEYRFDIARRHVRQLDARINGMYTPALYVGYVQYGGASVTLSPSPGRTDYWLHLPLRGHLEATLGHDSVLCDGRRGVIVSPTRERCALVSEENSSRIQLSLNRAALTAHLTALLGEMPSEPLEFDSTIDLTTGSGLSLARYIFATVADLEDEGSVLQNPMIVQAFEQFIMTALLLCHPHNYSESLRRPGRHAAPRDVRRALDYIDAHLERAVTVADIVKASGVPGRTLFMHFKEFNGASPMRYVRDARLRQVHSALLRAEPEASITDIAMSAGFTHMGRFSADYRRRFGESPSETLRRRKAPRSPARN